jgi:UDP-2,3-diacylglucosamine pyrophosphatase LpxH
MKNNIYIKSLEIGYNNISGISFDDLILKINNNLLKDERLSFHFNIWFYTNFYNENAYSDVLLHNTFANHAGKITFSDKEKITQYNNELSFIKGDSISKYIEYIELKEARKSSNRAFIISLLSFITACASVGITFILENNNKPIENIEQSKKGNCSAECEPNHSNKSEFTIKKVIEK